MTDLQTPTITKFEVFNHIVWRLGKAVDDIDKYEGIEGLGKALQVLIDERDALKAEVERLKGDRHE